VSGRRATYLVARREVRERLRSRAFRVGLAIQLLVIGAIAAVAIATGGDDGPEQVRVATVGAEARAAGETAPIIFTAAVSVGRPLALWQTLTQPTPALSWNIYNLSTEHEAVDELRHVQFGLVFVLVTLVLLLNGAALVLRARVSRRMKT